MGWTIDVPPTPKDQFPAALDAAQRRAHPQGTIDLYEQRPDGEWLIGVHRAEVAAQISTAIAEAKEQAAATDAPYVSASLVGHLHHPGLPVPTEWVDGDEENGLVERERAEGCEVVVQGHDEPDVPEEGS